MPPGKRPLPVGQLVCSVAFKILSSGRVAPKLIAIAIALSLAPGFTSTNKHGVGVM